MAAHERLLRTSVCSATRWTSQTSKAWVIISSLASVLTGVRWAEPGQPGEADVDDVGHAVALVARPRRPLPVGDLAEPGRTDDPVGPVRVRLPCRTVAKATCAPDATLASASRT